MNKSFNCYSLGFASIFLVIATEPAVAVDYPTDVAALRKQLQTGWEHLQQLDERLQKYEVLLVMKPTQLPFDPNLKQSGGRTQVSVDWPNTHRLMQMVDDDPASPPVVYGRNPDYAFVLGKTGTGWRLQGYSHAKPKTNRIDQDTLGTVPVRNILYPLSSTFFDDYLQLDLLKDKGFQLTDFKEMADNKVSIQFTFTHTFPDNEATVVTFDGDMLANRNLYWVVEEWNISVDRKPSRLAMTRSIMRAADTPDIVLCKSITRHELKEEYSFDYEKYSFAQVPLEPYRLSYYGLPEPHAAPHPSNRFFWLTLVAFGVLGLAIVCWTIARRLRPRAEPRGLKSA